jgi:hypothetical protein
MLEFCIKASITKHLQFKSVFEEKPQAKEFRTAAKNILSEFRKRKLGDLSSAMVVPDIVVEFQPIQKENWEGTLSLVEGDQYEKIENGIEPSSDYGFDTYSLTSGVSVNQEARLRMLEREDSPNLFRQKPEKCHIVRQADDPTRIKNPNNIVYTSRFLHQQLDGIDSTEGTPQFYFRDVAHSKQHHQGMLNNKVSLHQCMRTLCKLCLRTMKRRMN